MFARKTKLFVVGIALGTTVVGLCYVVQWIVLAYSFYFTDLPAASRLAETFVQALRDDDLRQAYSLTTSEYQRTHSYEKFVEHTAAVRSIAKQDIWTIRSVRLHGDRYEQASLTTTFSGWRGDVCVLLKAVKSEDVWALESFEELE